MAPRGKKGAPAPAPAPQPELVAEPAPAVDDAVHGMCAAVKEDVLQQMWGKGWQGPYLETYEAVASTQSGDAHFVKVHVGAEHIDEFALLHITGGAESGWTLHNVKLRHPADEGPGYF